MIASQNESLVVNSCDGLAMSDHVWLSLKKCCNFTVCDYTI